MRRVSLVLLALIAMTLFGCDALRDAFSPRADVVARANDQTLTVERLAGWAGQSKQGPLDPLTLRRVSRYWKSRCEKARAAGAAAATGAHGRGPICAARIAAFGGPDVEGCGRIARGFHAGPVRAGIR